MAITLTSDEYDEIRLLIGGDIDDEDLSDARINGGTVLGAAESYALRRIPGGQNGLSTADLTCLSASDTVSGRVDTCAVVP